MEGAAPSAPVDGHARPRPTGADGAAPSTCLVVVGVLLALTGTAAAKDRTPAEWQGSIDVEEAWTDNLQSKPPPGRDEDWFTTFTAVVDRDQRKTRYTLSNVGLFVRGAVYARFPKFNYTEIEGHGAFRLERTELLLSYRYTPERLLFDEEDDGGDDVFYVGNLLRTGLARRFGAQKEIDTRLLALFDWRSFIPPDRGRSSFEPGVLGDLRYNRWTVFMPRLALEYGSRNAVDNNYSRNDVKLTVGAQSLLPWWDLVVRGRYRSAWRLYTAPGPVSVNDNHGRDDDVQTFEIGVFIPILPVPGLQVGLRYAYQDGASTDPDHVFTSNEVGLSVTYGHVFQE